MSEMSYMCDTMLDGICRLRLARLDKVHADDADLFLCGLSQITWVSQVLPRKKFSSPSRALTKTSFTGWRTCRRAPSSASRTPTAFVPI